jgi:hypothetical protein
MAGSLPTVRGGAAALYPVTRSIEFLTDIAIALNATEQRAKRRPPLIRWNLPYTRVNATDTAAIKAFFESQKGTFDSTWTFTLDGYSYTGLTFEDDVFTVQEDAGTPTYYSFTLRARQVIQQAGAWGVSAPGGAFPAMANGATAMLPYRQTRRFSVLLNDNPNGPRYAYSWFAGGLSGFPTRSLRGWRLTYPVLSDADRGTIQSHFRSQWGKWSAFSFTDPDDATVYPKCRYDTDALQVVYNEPGRSSMTFDIIETN